MTACERRYVEELSVNCVVSRVYFIVICDLFGCDIRLYQDVWLSGTARGVGTRVGKKERKKLALYFRDLYLA